VAFARLRSVRHGVIRDRRKPEGSQALRRWLIAGAIYLAVCAAVLVFVGQRLIRVSRTGRHSVLVKNVYAPRRPGRRLDELKGNGRIYLVQMGEHKVHTRSMTSLSGCTRSMRWTCRLFRQLPSTVPPGLRAQAVCRELLYEQIKREHPDLATNPNAYLIGFTDADMYSVLNGWKYTFTQRYESRFAVISTNEE